MVVLGLAGGPKCFFGGGGVGSVGLEVVHLLASQRRMAWGRSGLRLRLQILVLLAVLPAVGLILYTASDQRRVASREVQQNALRLAKVAAADHELLVDGEQHKNLQA